MKNGPKDILTILWSLVDENKFIVNLLQKCPAVILHYPAVNLI